MPSGGTPFLMTGAVGGNSQAGAAIAACRNDFLFIPDSFDVTNTFSDRYCGGFLNPAAGAGLAANTEVCCKIMISQYYNIYLNEKILK